MPALKDVLEARVILGITWCPTCLCDTMVMDSGICGFCDTQLGPKRTPAPRPRDERGRLLPLPLPIPPVVGKGHCLFCGYQLAAAGRYKKLYCSPAHGQAYWAKYTEKGRDWMRRNNRRQVAA